MKDSIFVFNRDLRLFDNTALIEAMNNSNQVLPVYFFGNDSKSIPSSRPFWFQFLIESLFWLGDEIQRLGGKLLLIDGKLSHHLPKLIETIGIKTVFLNRDYSPMGLKNQQYMKKSGINFHISNDYVLNTPESILTKAKNPYRVFTPFFNYSRTIPVQKPSKPKSLNFFTEKVPNSNEISLEHLLNSISNNVTHFEGGRKNALEILRDLKKFKDYENERDIPSINGTTSLSAHLNLGTCSIREAYYEMLNQLGIEHPLVRQLYWREFYVYVGTHFPHVFKSNFRKKYNRLEWSYDRHLFDVWKKGETGFPIVDAGMRQLNQSGFMHNRIRMLTASFLTKDLHIDWRWGEEYFEKKLADFDPMLNNGNWQWVAGTGCDAAPYFRIFNPWTQQKKYDPQCKYIKKWIPELEDVPAKLIHNISKIPLEDSIDYPKPVTDHAKARIETLAIYKSI